MSDVFSPRLGRPAAHQSYLPPPALPRLCSCEPVQDRVRLTPVLLHACSFLFFGCAWGKKGEGRCLKWGESDVPTDDGKRCINCYNSQDTAVPGSVGVSHVSGKAGALGGGGGVLRGTKSDFLLLCTMGWIYAVRRDPVVNRFFPTVCFLRTKQRET